MRDEKKFLNEIKRALMLTEDDLFADDELMLHICSCENLLVSMGMPEEIAKGDESLIKGIILIYVKTYYGFKNDGSVKELPSSFDLLVRQAILTKGGD